MSGVRPRVAVVRGAELNPFEMQAYPPLAAEFDVVLVGARRGHHETRRLGLPVELLAATDGRRVTAALSRRAGRFVPAAEPGRLLGLARATAGVDILHAAETSIPWTAQCAALSRRTGARLVLTCWENIPFRFEETARARTRKAAVQAQCALFLAVTPPAADALRAEGVAAERIRVVPAAVDVERFRPAAPDPALRARLGLPADALVVLFVGRLIAEKGVVELVRALAAVPEIGGRAVHLLLVGSGDQGGRVDAAAAALGASGRVHRSPAVGYADVPALYALADVVVAPSLSTPYWQEQFGMVLVEVMASGCALVSTRSGSIPDVVGDAATLVEPYRVAELRAAVAGLLADPAERARLGAAGRRRAERHYAPAVVAPAIADAYREVLAGRAGR